MNIQLLRAMGGLGGGGENYCQLLQKTFGSDIIAHYPFDDTAGTSVVDKINGYNLTRTATGITLGADGYKGKSYGFTGTGRCSIANIKERINRDELTVIFWAYLPLNSFNDANVHTFINIQSENAYDLIQIIKSPSARRILLVVKRNNTLYQTQHAITYDQWFMATIVISASGSYVKSYINSAPSTYTPEFTSIVASQGNTFFTNLSAIGASRNDNGSLPLIGNMNHLTFINRAATVSEIEKLFPYDRVFFIGDSRTATGFHLHLSVGDKLLSPYNLGVSGATIQGCIDVQPAKMSLNLRAGKKNYAVVWAGVNSSGLTPAQMYSQLSTLCTGAKTAGAHKVVLCTEIDATAAMPAANSWHTKYQELNALLIANPPADCDAIADLASIPEATNATNLTYFPDQLHPSSSLGRLFAPVIFNALKSIL